MRSNTTARTLKFPATRQSLIVALADTDVDRRRAAADLFTRAYWVPVATTLQSRWHLAAEDVEDLTQEFFAEALAKDWLLRYDPAQARFRTFVRMCADRFAASTLQASRRLKRGGGATILSLDDIAAVASDEDVDLRFRQEWVRSVFELGLESLREQGRRERKEIHVAIFEAYDIDEVVADQRPSYRDLAARFSLPETTITNHLAWARRAFRGHVLDALRSLAGSDAEYREDVQELLGITPP